MALSAAQLASLTALLASRRGRYSLSSGQRAKLLSLFTGMERPSDELPLVLGTEDDLSTYLQEWKEFCADAGLDSSLHGAESAHSMANSANSRNSTKVDSDDSMGNPSSEGSDNIFDSDHVMGPAHGGEKCIGSLLPLRYYCICV